MGRFFMSLFGCLTVPFHRLILVHSSANEIEAVIIKFAKFILRFGIALFRRPVKPLRRQPQVVCRLPERFDTPDLTPTLNFNDTDSEPVSTSLSDIPSAPALPFRPVS